MMTEPNSPESRMVKTPLVDIALVMPNVDLTAMEATVVAWRKERGDAVAAGEAVVDVETEKAVVSVESPVDGVLAEIFAQAGEIVKIGKPLGIIRRTP